MRVRRSLGILSETDYYSQAGEDAILSNVFTYVRPVQKGFYIDIGAYHPVRHSNTYLLYRSGWSGINIDPRPGTKALFDKCRPRDINVECGVGSADGEMTYYILGDDSTMNTFSKENLEKLNLIGSVKRTLEIPVYSFSTLLKKHPTVNKIDYINIDAEGFEEEILEGIFESGILPTVISIEQNDIFSLADVLETKICKRLSQNGYVPFAKNILIPTISTVFYILREEIR